MLELKGEQIKAYVRTYARKCVHIYIYVPKILPHAWLVQELRTLKIMLMKLISESKFESIELAHCAIASHKLAAIYTCITTIHPSVKLASYSYVYLP